MPSGLFAKLKKFKEWYISKYGRKKEDEERNRGRKPLDEKDFLNMTKKAKGPSSKQCKKAFEAETA